MTERSPIIPQEPEAEQETINPLARHPFAGTDLDPARKGHQEKTIELAAGELWPPDGQPPAHLSKAERNGMIWTWYKHRGINCRYWPSKRHLRRVFNGR